MDVSTNQQSCILLNRSPILIPFVIFLPCFPLDARWGFTDKPQMLAENLLAKFKQMPMTITAMRALKGERMCLGFCLWRAPTLDAID